MSNGRRLFGAALVYTISNAFGAGVPILLLPLLTRVLTPAEYGVVGMFGVAVAVLAAFTGLSSLGAINVRYFAPERFDLRRYVASCLAILLASSAAALLFAWLLLPWLEAWIHVPGRWILVAVGVAAAQFVVQVQLVLWQSAQRPWSYFGLRAGQATFDATFSLMFVVALGLAWQGRLGSIALAAGLSVVVALVLLGRGGWLSHRPRRDHVVDALRFGVPLIPHTIGSMLVLMADRVLISNVLDVASAGIYLVAMQLGMVLGLLTDAANKAFAPWLMGSLNQSDAARNRRIVRFTYFCFAGLAVVALLFAWIAPWLLSWLVGPKYHAAGPVMGYIAMGFAFGGMYYMVTNYVFFAGRTAGLALITFAAGLFNVGITYLLLKQNGVTGAAQGFMLSQAATFLGTWWLAQKSHPMPWRRCLEPAT